jgi:hypothetical protein
MPTYSNDGTTFTLFVFNHIIARFGVPKTIVMDHGSHFHNKMMIELVARLGFFMKIDTLLSLVNGQVEAINHVLKTMI